MNKVTRCNWVSEDPLYQKYHDKEWGRPVEDSQQLFAKLCLEGQQAGLSWITVLKKQKNYEAAFFDFLPSKIVEMTEDDVELLMTNAGLIRHRLKLNAIVKNAKAYLSIEQKQSFSDYIWAFTVHVPAHSDHPFRFNPITDFGLIRSPISALSDQK